MILVHKLEVVMLKELNCKFYIKLALGIAEVFIKFSKL